MVVEGMVVVVVGASVVVVVVVVDATPPAGAFTEPAMVRGVQAEPFQCRITIWGTGRIASGTLPADGPCIGAGCCGQTEEPTVVASQAGKCHTCQAVPVHCSTRLLVGPSPLPLSPTAHDLPDARG